MQIAKIITVTLLVLALVGVPVAASAHWHGGGGLILGFGAGLLSGYFFAPRPVYVAPPVYAAPVYTSAPAYVAPAAPAPVVQSNSIPGPPPSAYSSNENTPPAPGTGPKCREWKLIDRHLENRWDSYYGKWQQVPVEKWGWAEIPCAH